MGLLNFIIVLGFNVWWAKEGLDNYKNMYNGNFNEWLSIGAWLFAAWGILNLVLALVFHSF